MTEVRVDGTVLTVTRVFEEPIDTVFDAWIDAAKTTHWWGCGATTKVASEVDPEPGGRYRHRMTIDQVGDHQIDGWIIEFDPPHSLAYRMPGLMDGPETMVRVTFTTVPEGTRVTLIQSPIDQQLTEVVSAGWKASFERLARFFTGERRAA